MGVVGAGECPPAVDRLAEETGERLARAGAIVVSGGLGGVMEAAARGAKRGGGLTVGILPGTSHREANPFIDIIVVTGLGHARNAIVARSSHALIALAGEYGTLSEIALALKMGLPVIGLASWEEIRGVIAVGSPEEAVKEALAWAERVHVRSR
ncbi:MAG: TIGR00725 family protein [Candidatus Rokubacteria bacterium]|nr:TIGR00725 family protein [Candidatus Rokubacteria bacterium]